MSSILMSLSSRPHGEPEEEKFPSTTATSPDRCTVYSLSGLSLTNASEAPETEEISHRQVKWDQEASVADEKQTQLFHSQWGLIKEQSEILRDQIRMLSRDVVGMRADLQSLKDWEGKSQLALQQQSEVLAELVEEPRLRRESDDKLAAEIKDNYTSLVAAINNEVKDRAAFFNDAMSLASHTKQLIEQESRDRTAAEKELARHMQAAVDAVERERLDREQSNTELRSHVSSLQQELTVEKAARSDEDAVLKRALQGLEAAAMQQMKDLRISIEAEMAARCAEDSRIAQVLENVQRLVDAEGGKLVRLSGDMEKNLSTLKKDLDQEVQSLSGQTLQLTSGHQKLQDAMEAECGNRAKAIAEIGDDLRNLSDSLLREAKDRSGGDQELKKEIISFFEALENETRQRAAGDRDLKDALQSEAEQRAEGDDKSKAGLNGLAGKLENEFNIVREMLAKEVRDRSSADDALSCIESRLKTVLEGEVHALRDADAHLGNDVREGLRQLAEALAQETSERITGGEDHGRQLLTTKQLLEKEVKDRSSGDADITAKLEDLTQSFDKQKRERAAGDEGWAKELEKSRSELANEKAARTDALSQLGLAVQTLDANTSQHLKDIGAKLETETKSRSASDSSLERQLVELSKTIKEEVAARVTGDNEHDKVLRALRQDLDAEAKQRCMSDDAMGNALQAEAAQRKAGDEAVSNNLEELSNKLSKALDGLSEALKKEMVDRDVADNEVRKIEERLKAALDIEACLRKEGDEKDATEWREVVKNLQVSFQVEMKDRGKVTNQLMQENSEIVASLEQEIQVRAASNEDFLKHLQEFQAELEREKEQRDRGDAVMRKGIEVNKQDLAGEKDERLKSDDAVRKELQAMLEQMNTQLLDALLKFDREMSARDLAIHQQEKSHLDLRASHDGEVDKRVKLCDDLEKRLRSLKADLEEEGKLRVATDDHLRDLISTETSDRIATDDANMHRLNSALVKLDSGVETFRNLLQGRLGALAGKLDKPRTVEPARVTTFYIGED